MNKSACFGRIGRRLALTLLALGAVGCSLRVHVGSNAWILDLGATPPPRPSLTPNPTYTLRPTYTPLATLTPLPTYTPLPLLSPTATTIPIWLPVLPTPGQGEISQFASRATASSQYSQPGWSAMQAAGAPDTDQCGDSSSAWASRQSDSKDWLLLSFEQKVVPTRILIYQTYHPGAVSKVQVIDDDGTAVTVYEAEPAIVNQCPYLLDIAVTDVATAIRAVRITIDQRSHNGWNEIDAVQLIGKPD